jgi:hypothetical protein
MHVREYPRYLQHLPNHESIIEIDELAISVISGEEGVKIKAQVSELALLHDHMNMVVLGFGSSDFSYLLNNYYASKKSPYYLPAINMYYTGGNPYGWDLLIGLLRDKPDVINTAIDKFIDVLMRLRNINSSAPKAWSEFYKMCKQIYIANRINKPEETAAAYYFLQQYLIGKYNTNKEGVFFSPHCTFNTETVEPNITILLSEYQTFKGTYRMELAPSRPFHSVYDSRFTWETMKEKNCWTFVIVQHFVKKTETLHKEFFQYCKKERINLTMCFKQRTMDENITILFARTDSWKL